MRLVVRRVLLAVLLLAALSLGTWAYAMPRKWYDTFPGYLALAVLTAGALWFAASDATVRITAAAWTTFNVLHLWYHVSTLQMYDGRDKVLVVTSLAILSLVSAALLLPLSRRERRSAP
jgi:hypothetical protein